jgi:hypothetical protein
MLYPPTACNIHNGEVLKWSARTPRIDREPYHTRQPVTLDPLSAVIWFNLAADPKPILLSPVAGTLIADPREPVTTRHCTNKTAQAFPSAHTATIWWAFCRRASIAIRAAHSTLRP